MTSSVYYGLNYVRSRAGIKKMVMSQTVKMIEKPLFMWHSKDSGYLFWPGANG